MSKTGSQQGGGTELSYDNIEKFMYQYFKSYTEYVNDPATIDKLDTYLAADFHTTFYMNAPGTGEYPFVQENRKMWKNFLLKGHQNSKEILSPLQLSIDERKGKVAAILDVKKENRTTGEKSQIIVMAIYGVGLEDNSIKLKSLNLCVDNPQRITETWK
jgi:hypothetical protein